MQVIVFLAIEVLAILALFQFDELFSTG